MANGFPSAGAGFSRGFATGSQLQLQRQEVRQNREAQEAKAQADRAKRFRELWDNEQETALETFNQGLEILQQAAEAGADDEQLQPIIQAVTTPLAMLSSHAQQLRKQAAAAGGDESVINALPDGLAIVRQNMPRVNAAIAAGRSMFTSPEEAGEEEAAAQLAEVRRIAEELGKPVEEVARAMGMTIEPAVPNVQNFQLPDGSMTGVDIATPDGPKKVQDLLNRGAVRVGLSVNAATPSDLSVTAQDISDFRNAEIAATTAVNEIQRLREQLGDTDLRTGMAGGLVRGLDTLADQMVQFASSFGFNEAELLDPSQYDLSSFGSQAQSSAAFRSNLINMFYVMARAAEPGARQLSTADIQNQANRFASSGSRLQMGAALNEIERSIKEQFGVRHQVLSRSAEVGPIPEALQMATEAEPVDMDALVQLAIDKNLTAADLAVLTDDEYEELERQLIERGISIE